MKLASRENTRNAFPETPPRETKAKHGTRVSPTRKSSCGFIPPRQADTDFTCHLHQPKSQTTLSPFPSAGRHDFLLQHAPAGQTGHLQLPDQGRDESAAGRRGQAEQRRPLPGQLAGTRSPEVGPALRRGSLRAAAGVRADHGGEVAVSPWIKSRGVLPAPSPASRCGMLLIKQKKVLAIMPIQ